MFQLLPLRVIVILSILLLGFFILVPLGIFILASFSGDPFRLGGFTLSHYISFFTSGRYLNSLYNTIIISIASAALSTLLGLFMAILIHKMDIPLKRYASASIIIAYIIPPYMQAAAWITMANPVNGILNILTQNLFGIKPFNVFSYIGLIWVLTAFTMPLAYLMISSRLLSIDSTLEDQSLVSGAGLIRTFRRVLVPLLLPSLFTAWLYSFVISAENFIIPYMIGVAAAERIETLAVTLYIDAFAIYPPNYATASIASVILLLISGMGSLIYYRILATERKYVTIVGRGFQTRAHILKRSYKLLLSISMIILTSIIAIIPLIAPLLMSLYRVWTGSLAFPTLANYDRMFSDPYFWRSLINILIVSSLAAAILAMFSFLIAYFSIRTKLKEKRILEFISTIPVAVPAIVAGFVILLAWYAYINLGIHGTLAILVLAAIFRFIPFSVRTISGGILSVSSELEEASSVSGATLTQTLRKVVTPLVSRQMLISAILTFTLVFRDAVTPLFIATGATMVLPLYIFYLWVTGYMEYAAAMITFQMLILFIITIIVMRFMGLEAFIRGR